MIDTLYEPFKKWSAQGSVYLISDPHLEDSDCALMSPDWPTPEQYIADLKKIVHKNDTLICLGDVGQPSWFKEIKAYKVLIKGNHDAGNKNYEPYFNEIYEGPLFISEKILLSHEPIIGLSFCLGIHGHTHDRRGGEWIDEKGGWHLNICSNTIGYKPINLGQLIKEGILSPISSIHRITIDKASAKYR